MQKIRLELLKGQLGCAVNVKPCPWPLQPLAPRGGRYSTTKNLLGRQHDLSSPRSSNKPTPIKLRASPSHIAISGRWVWRVRLRQYNAGELKSEPCVISLRWRVGNNRIWIFDWWTLLDNACAEHGDCSYYFVYFERRVRGQLRRRRLDCEHKTRLLW